MAISYKSVIGPSMALSFSHHPVLHGNKLPLALQSQCITSSKPNNTCTFTYPSIRCCSSLNQKNSINLKTCKNCKTQFDPSLNHPHACRFHTSHFGGSPLRFSLSSCLFCPCTMFRFKF